MRIAVDRRTQIMTVEVIIGGHVIAERCFRVITAVETDGDSSKMSATRLQSNQTHPTQFPDGEYGVTRSKLNPLPDSRFDTYWLDTDATQVLTNTSGKRVTDGGYRIHHTPLDYTDGCIGVPSEQDMTDLKELYELNEANDPGTTTICVHSSIRYQDQRTEER